MEDSILNHWRLIIDKIRGMYHKAMNTLSDRLEDVTGGSLRVLEILKSFKDIDEYKDDAILEYMFTLKNNYTVTTNDLLILSKVFLPEDIIIEHNRDEVEAKTLIRFIYNKTTQEADGQ